MYELVFSRNYTCHNIFPPLHTPISWVPTPTLFFTCSSTGIYKCRAHKYRKALEVEITVTVKDEAEGCNPKAPENGSVEPSEMVAVDKDVVYTCNKGFALAGKNC